MSAFFLLFLVVVFSFFAAELAPVTAGGPDSRQFVRIGDPALFPAELTEPERRTRWRADTLPDAHARFTRTVELDGTRYHVVDRQGDESAHTTFTSNVTAHVEHWLRPSRQTILRPGQSRTLYLKRTTKTGMQPLTVELRGLGAGWIHLPAGPREVVLERARVSVGEPSDQAHESTVTRWIDPRAGVVAERIEPVGQPPSLNLTTDGPEAAADLKLYADELDLTPNSVIRYGWDRGAGTPVSSVTPDGFANIGLLVQADTWDFSGNNTGLEIASTTVPLDAAHTCNMNLCGFVDPANRVLGREDTDWEGSLAITNNVFERVETATEHIVWLRAGRQREGATGAFGTGETGFCYDPAGGKESVPQWVFAHQDADGFFAMPGDSWEGPGDTDGDGTNDPFDCEQNLYNYSNGCGSGGGLSDQYSSACNAFGSPHAGTQAYDVVKGGVVITPSGHTFNSQLIEIVAEFCVYTGSSCFLPANDVRTVVHVFQAPNIGTVARLTSEQAVAPRNSGTGQFDYTTLENTDFKFGLFPPLTLESTAADDTTIDISWNPGNDVHRIDDYKIYWDTDSGDLSNYAFNSDDNPGQVSFAGTTATISGLSPGTNYFITVTSRSTYTDPKSLIATQYESLLYPRQTFGDPNFTYPVELMVTTTGAGCAPSEEVSGLVIDKQPNGDIQACWNAVADACPVGYDVIGSNDASTDAGYQTVGQVGLQTCWTGPSDRVFHLTVTRGPAGDQGPWGHYGR